VVSQNYGIVVKYGGVFARSVACGLRLVSECAVLYGLSSIDRLPRSILRAVNILPTLQ
jgi:hypothetical protein